jgi:hypothetical protein
LGVGFNVDTTIWIVAGKLEVANRDARQTVQGFECDGLGQLNVVENRAQSGDTKLRRRNRPIEAWIMQKEYCELCES